VNRVGKLDVRGWAGAGPGAAAPAAGSGQADCNS